jgi:hypothetical protein
MIDQYHFKVAAVLLVLLMSLAFTLYGNGLCYCSLLTVITVFGIRFVSLDRFFNLKKS